MRSLRLKVALWFTLSVCTVLGVFALITYSHLVHELRVERWERARPEGRDWTLHGNYSQSEVDDIAGELWRLSLLYALPVAGAAFAIGYVLARRSFKPVADLNRQLGEIGVRSLGRRIALPAVDREFEPTIAHINSLLERLESAFAQLTEYSAQVAHELRTPLALLRLKLEEGSERIDPEFSEAIQEELARLSAYVDQCLLLATAEQGRLEVRSETVRLRELLEEMLETYRLWAGQSGRTVTLNASDDITVRSDPRYLRQILHNLLANAVRHGQGTIAVTLSLAANGTICRIENIVAPNKSDRPATGIGLRIVRALAVALGSSVETRTAENIFIAELIWKPAGLRSSESPAGVASLS
jgi:signal transduction histidine kinase